MTRPHLDPAVDAARAALVARIGYTLGRPRWPWIPHRVAQARGLRRFLWQPLPPQIMPTGPNHWNAAALDAAYIDALMGPYLDRLASQSPTQKDPT